MKQLTEHLNDSLDSQLIDESLADVLNMVCTVLWYTWVGYASYQGGKEICRKIVNWLTSKKPKITTNDVTAALKTRPKFKYHLPEFSKEEDPLGFFKNGFQVNGSTILYLQILCNKVLKHNYFDEQFDIVPSDMQTDNYSKLGHSAVVLLNAMVDCERNFDETQLLCAIADGMLNSKYADKIPHKDFKDLEDIKDQLEDELWEMIKKGEGQ